MRVLIYGRNFQDIYNTYVSDFFKSLHNLGFEVCVNSVFLDFLVQKIGLKPDSVRSITKLHELDCPLDMVLSIGGDGTILDALTFLNSMDVPIVGINTGKLGFLANIAIDDVPGALDMIVHNKYSFDERTLIKINADIDLFDGVNYALNEVAIQKKDTTMITIHTYIDGEFLNTYWADGLIISTPTGSTAYSLSVGGPIILPYSKNFIISPISPHNLTVRPIVVPDYSKIQLKFESRSGYYLVSLDHRYEVVKQEVSIQIEKAEFKVRIVKLENTNFYSTLRNKLMWGVDKRN